MKRFIVPLTLVGILTGSLFFAGCYKYHDDVYLDELDITLTYYDNEVDFQGYTTFAVRDSVALVPLFTVSQEITKYTPDLPAQHSLRRGCG